MPDHDLPDRFMVKDHTGATVMAALAGIALGVMGTLLFLKRQTSGDEPPIRVKNGSIELYLLSSTASWEDAGNHWKISAGTKANDDYQAAIESSCNMKAAKGKKIRLLDPNQNWIELRPRQRQTKVTSNLSLTIVLPEKRVLRYADWPYIERILVDETPVCTFTSSAGFTDMFLFDC